MFLTTKKISVWLDPKIAHGFAQKLSASAVAELLS